MLDKIAQFDVPDKVYNWMVNFFSGHSHCIHHIGEESAVSEITASIVQGSSIGPASYVVNTADLKAITPGNRMIKFADDTYIVTPAANANSGQAELDSVEEWSRTNNLKVNPTKYAEIIFTDKRRKTVEHPPAPMPNINRVLSMKIMGVTSVEYLVQSIFRLL